MSDFLRLFLFFAAFVVFLSGAGAVILGTGPVPTGSMVDVNVSGTDISVQFANVSVAGTLTADRELECGESFLARGSCVYLSTTATYTEGMGFNEGVISCFSYSDFDITNDSGEENFEVMHYNGATWQNSTYSIDTEANILCAKVSNFSPFAVSDGTPALLVRSSVPGMGLVGFFTATLVALAMVVFQRKQ
ncbi:MAG: hypothetical protein J7K00_03750 [Candidatus Diapherotrites archaeon]|nr:hypothetical protein [Candidatus Diapherotrites archaeon]